MNNLKKLLLTPLQVQTLPKWIAISILVISVIGFADATFLSIEHFKGEIPPCTIEGCEIVLSSEYSQVLGIPIALFGSIYYLTLAFLTLAFINTKKEIFLRIAMFMSILGLVTSVVLVSLMLFIIKALCQYCLVSAATSVSIFIISIYGIYKNTKNTVTV